MSLETDTITLPVEYASYLINGDHSALTEEEVETLDQWLEGQQGDTPFYISDVADEVRFGMCPITGVLGALAEYTIIYR